MERLSRIELDDYCENAGLTNLQKQILKMKYFDPDEPTVIAICFRLSISEHKFYSAQRALLRLIYKYENLKGGKSQNERSNEEHSRKRESKPRSAESDKYVVERKAAYDEAMKTLTESYNHALEERKASDEAAACAFAETKIHEIDASIAKLQAMIDETAGV